MRVRHQLDHRRSDRHIFHTGGDDKGKVMNIKTFTFLTVVVALLTGCAGRTVLLANDKGLIAKCEVSTAATMWTGIIIRNMTINNCVSEFERAGYKRVGT